MPTKLEEPTCWVIRTTVPTFNMIGVTLLDLEGSIKRDAVRKLADKLMCDGSVVVVSLDKQPGFVAEVPNHATFEYRLETIPVKVHKAEVADLNKRIASLSSDVARLTSIHAQQTQKLLAIRNVIGERIER